ncbi:MAG: ATP-grasp domain-containing protein [Acidobacteria bacterium]|nr:ATP-grasp domain-containing protein [Acidobacteriota bacterium]
MAYIIAADLYRRGVHVEAIGATGLSPCRFSRYVARFHLGPALADTAAYVAEVCRLCRERRLDIFLPSCREVFQLAPYAGVLCREARYPFPGGDVLERVNDKAALNLFAERAGIETPQSVVLPAGCQDAEAAAGLRFPVIVKPTGSYGGKGCTVARDASELARILAGSPGQGCRLVQEYIPGPMIVWSGIRWQGGPAAGFCFEALKTSPAIGGYSVMRRSVRAPELDAPVARLLEVAGYHGFCTLDFIRHRETGEHYLIDFNPRFGTSLHAPLAAGISFPFELIALTRGEQRELPACPEGVLSLSLSGHVGRILRRKPNGPPLPSLCGDLLRAMARIRHSEEVYMSSPFPFFYLLFSLLTSARQGRA